MRRVIIYSLLLVGGMGLSQLAFVQLFNAPIATLTMIFLAYIMIEVGMEFDIDKSRLSSYAVDYGIAMAAAAVFYDQDARGKARNAHVGVIGVGDRPLRLSAVEDVLNGQSIDEATIAKADAAASAAVDPQDDIHASAAYRRSLVGTMVERALRGAAAA